MGLQMLARVRFDWLVKPVLLGFQLQDILPMVMLTAPAGRKTISEIHGIPAFGFIVSAHRYTQTHTHVHTHTPTVI